MAIFSRPEAPATEEHGVDHPGTASSQSALDGDILELRARPLTLQITINIGDIPLPAVTVTATQQRRYVRGEEDIRATWDTYLANIQDALTRQMEIMVRNMMSEAAEVQRHYRTERIN
ncbi:uncharacterized protein TRAVEDRAFT_19499 [Trametes versicolor FP-101664 SS1]|uniref:uncharacterized protein n=1 Tax=Trametes versicolor (strain FP-101664) TaxID=717944 RepID=UPI0004624600|nr:uncharacterized protein TRAVEDRAFT_19499 [Trametes versicolor FP-101664 SS1]EIW60984.1 hypothetical protein TRAVEDRAFT_19499 [Trametes versicolor FP-101664 SS1]